MAPGGVDLLDSPDIETRTLNEPSADAAIETIMGFRIEDHARKAGLHGTGLVKKDNRLVAVDAQQTCCQFYCNPPVR
jgi:hypothetical protein